MPVKLYFSPGACSFVPHALLELIGEPFEPVLVKLHRKEQDSPAYRAINPRGQVPVLVDGELVITQVLAIVMHLHERFPSHGILPADPLARVRTIERLAWMNNTAHPTFTHVFMPHKFVEGQAAQEQVRAHNVPAYRAVLDELEAWASETLADGRSWLHGERPGPLDAYALTLTRWGGLAGIDPTGFPTLWGHAGRFAQLPAVARAIERERLQLNMYKPS